MRKSQIGVIVLLMAVTVALAGCSRVGEDWKAAQAADTTEAYQDFLRQHPDSEFGVPAQERIKQLAEDRDWQAASKADTLDAYQQFVAAHADGKWAQEARVRIENFQLGAGGQAPPTAAAGATPAAPATPVPAVRAPTVTPPGSAAPSAASAPPAIKPAIKPAATSKPAAAARTAGGTHYAQLGAFASKAAAQAGWHKLSGRFAALKSLQPHYASGTSHGKAIVRLRVGLSSSERVHELCAALKKQSQACIPVS
ncbi:MAG TPA: SPOR domain-containing protein [Steroidobacteraceae bacterium]|nr:SPOR domain-containing protein [Steroidobacteraceae bacterium]